MKKLILVIAVALVGFTSNAQSISAGLSGGLPSGDASDLYTFAVILDASVHFEAGDSFMVGGATGYINSFGDEVDFGGFGTVEVEDAGFIPVAASARYMVSDAFSLGADVGYALGVSPDTNDGGFYYAPKAVYNVSETFGIVAAYRGVSLDGGSFDVLSLGFEFKFN